MSIVGGAVLTPLMGLIADSTKSLALAYCIPLAAYVLIGFYSFLLRPLCARQLNFGGIRVFNYIAGRLKMFTASIRVMQRSTLLFALGYLMASTATAQQAQRYEPTIESLDRHPLPDWYADAKLGIFIHWGLYSVPGWAPLVHPEHDFASPDYITNNPYAEWYLNTMRIDGSPTQKYHREHYGANYDYYNFAQYLTARRKSGIPIPGPKYFATPAPDT